MNGKGGRGRNGRRGRIEWELNEREGEQGGHGHKWYMTHFTVLDGYFKK
jgi:hypothetical protein